MVDCVTYKEGWNDAFSDAAKTFALPSFGNGWDQAVGPVASLAVCLGAALCHIQRYHGYPCKQYLMFRHVCGSRFLWPQ